MRPFRFRPAPLLALALAASSCTTPRSMEVPPGTSIARRECQSPALPRGKREAVASGSGAAVLTLAGPSGRHQLIVPQGGAPPGTRFSMEAVDSPYVGVELRANGLESFKFADGRPAVLVLSAHHCSDNELGDSAVIARTERALVPYPTTRVGKAFSTRLPTLSGYAIAGN